MHLHRASTLVDIPIAFDLGLDKLGLKLDGGVQLDVGFDWNLTVGVNKQSGFYIGTDAANQHQLSFFVDASIPGFNATGTLGFLQAKATDDPTAPSHLGAAINVSIRDPGQNDNKLTLAELTTNPITQVISVDFDPQATASVNLKLTAGFGADFPSISTEFHLNWNFGNGNSSPAVAFDDVELNAGSFIRNLVGPVIDTVNSALAPIKPILDVLETPLPVISQLAGRNFTLLDIAKLFGYLDQGTYEFINSVEELANMVSALQGFVDDNGSIGFGDFSLANYDPRTADLQSINISSLPGYNTPPLTTDAAVNHFLDSAGPNLSSHDGKGLEFPILKSPATALGILFGKPVDLFTYDMPTLGVDSRFMKVFPVFPPFLNVILAGRIGAGMHFSFGYDTYGLNEFAQTGDAGKVADGFYINNTAGNQVQLLGAIGAGAAAGVDLGVFKALVGVIGGLTAQVGLKLHDPNHDGRVRAGEIAQDVQEGGLLGLFDANGAFKATLTAFIDLEVDLGFTSITIINAQKEIAAVTLLSFDTDRTPGDPNLGHMDGSTLVLNVQGNDNFRVRQGSNANEMIVTARGTSETFSNVQSISADASNQTTNETFNIDASVALPVTIKTGSGKDQINLGAGTSYVDSGAGDDTIVAGTGSATVYAGAGNDTIVGGQGNDELHGGADNDRIDCGAGNNYLYGDEGDDVLTGGFNNDTIFGGAGNDRIDGGLGDDTLWGDAPTLVGGGDDYITGGDGADIIHAGGGNDTLYGGLGNDTIYGDDGNDYIDAGRSNDTVYGGIGADVIYGGPGSDTLYGNEGDDTIYAGVSDVGGDTGAINFIDAGAGNDLVYGDIGDDTIFGGDDNDTIYALAGNDTVDAGMGDDLVYGGTGSDFLIGGWGRDTIYAGTGATGGGTAAEQNTIIGDVQIAGAKQGDDKATLPANLVASDNNDLIYGDVGADTIFGDFGNDTIYGLQGSDTIDAGWGADTVYAGVNESGSGASTDQNLVYGDPQAGGAIPGSERDHDDVIYGDIGNDIIFSGAGNDRVYALAGSDQVYAGSGDDTIYGGDGADLLVGGTGDDTIDGGVGNDAVWGGNASIGFENWTFDTSMTSAFTDSANFPGATWSDHSHMPLIVPVALGGQTVDGTFDDGNDTLYGGADTDWIFGGGGNDVLYGDTLGASIPGSATYNSGSSDYLDGGAGNDYVHGGGGDDIVRGGSNDDILHGDAGIDQLYGDAGSDYLFADAGDSSGNQTGQRLFGGSGIDYLYAYSPTANYDPASPTTEINKAGDELHGGNDGDWLYGSIRRDTLYGDGGNDTILGDGVIGPNYAVNDLAAYVGADDVLYGGTGEDKLYGGGGNDTLWGGSDSDWLEGQNGNDVLYGGAGIDELVMDVDRRFDLPNPPPLSVGWTSNDAYYGYYGNEAPDPASDDHATDILLVEGTDHDDTITLAEPDVSLMGAGDLPSIGQLSTTAQFTLTLTSTSGTTSVPFSVPAGNYGTAAGLVTTIRSLVGGSALGPSVDVVQFGNQVGFITKNAGHNASLVVSSTNATTRDSLHLAENQAAVPLLRVGYQVYDTTSHNLISNQNLFANWRDSVGDPVVQQFRVSGLGGNDNISFPEGPNALDVSALTARSNDWVSAIDGGPGNDVLTGTGGRDRIDGGFGSDTIYGLAGDDQLWGDGGPGQGLTTDHDRLFGGQGNDDLLGGQGFNELMSWSHDPDPVVTQLHFFNGSQSSTTGNGPQKLISQGPLPFDGRLDATAVFTLSVGGGSPVTVTVPADSANQSPVDLLSDITTALNTAGLASLVQASLTGNPGDADRRLVLTSNSAGSPSLTLATTWSFGTFVDSSGQLHDGSTPNSGYTLEDTGLNRMLGQTIQDWLFGGTSLDFMYGQTNGTTANSSSAVDQLIDRHGNLFSAYDASVAGDDWKKYAQSTSQVWYYSATNKDDLIHVDYVTEPGLLTQHHLITRLTNNNGNYTFDAQVKLDFGATDASGQLIWNPNDTYYGLAATASDAVLPMLLGSADLPTNGQLGADTSFDVSVNGGEYQTITITKQSTDGNATATELIADINASLAAAGLADQVAARLDGNRLSLVYLQATSAVSERTADTPELKIRNLSGSAAGQLYLAETQASKHGVLSGDATFSISLDGAAPVLVTVPQASTASNTSLHDLLASITAAIGNATDAAGLHSLAGKVGVRLDGNKISFVRIDPNQPAGASLVVLNPNSIAQSELFLSDGLTDTAGFVGSYDLSTLLPPEGIFQAIIVDALAGNDQIIVGPTVTKSVWVDGGAGNDTIQVLPGHAVLPDATDPLASRNDTATSAYDLRKDPRVGMISGNRTVTGLTLDSATDQDWYKIKFTGSGAFLPGDALTISSLSASDGVVLELYSMGSGESLGTLLKSTDASGRIDLQSLTHTKDESYYLHVRSNAVPTIYELAFATRDWAQSDSGGATQAHPFNLMTLSNSSNITNYGTFSGLSLFTDTSTLTPGESWFQFSLDHTGAANEHIDITRRTGDTLSLELVDSLGRSLQSVDTAPSATAGVRLQGLSAGTYFLHVYFKPSIVSAVNGETPSRLPHATYDMNTVVGSSPGTLVYNPQLSPNIALNDPTIVDRKDALMGGDGNDVISGGSYEDWIFGGAGNDVLTGGADEQAGDLVWGGAGDDIFQIVPDALPLTNPSIGRVNPLDQTRYLPTLTDRFDGGDGHNTIEFLGGDLDPNGSPIPDNLAVRYNTLLHRYELTSQVWDYVNQKWVTDPRTGLNAQYYAFYQANNFDNTVIDTGAGNDEVHAEPGFLIPLFGGGASEWGVAAEARPQGANPNLVIRGGDGNDRLFGGAGDDTISGGAGADVIAGGGGSDQIDGGAGNDWIGGGIVTTAPDRYELASGQANDSPGAASQLIEDFSPLIIGKDVTISGLTFSQNDGDDWYIVKTPVAAKRFGTSQGSWLTKNMLQVAFDDPSTQPIFDRFQGSNLYLYAGQTSGTGSGLTVTPVEQFSGVPDYYVVRVVNVNRLAITGTPLSSTFAYRLLSDATFSLSVDGGPAVPITVAAASTSTNLTLRPGC